MVRLYDAALERWLTSPFIDEFWSSAVIHVVVRWVRLVTNNHAPSTDAAHATFVLAKIIGPFIAPDEHFLRLVRSLQLNGTSIQAIKEALESNGSNLDHIAEVIRALADIDARFAASALRLLADIQANPTAEIGKLE